MEVLIALALLAYALFAAWRLRAWWKRRRAASAPPPEGYVVTVDAGRVRGGFVEYREGEDSARFSWEHLTSGRSGVVFVAVPGVAAWDREVPWAVGRREEVLTRVGRELERQKCPGCKWEIQDRRIVVHTTRPFSP